MATPTDQASQRVLEITIRVGVTLLLIAWCVDILLPFLNPVLWGAIFAIAIAPLHQRIAAALGGRTRLAAAIVSLAALALLLVPCILLCLSVAHSVHQLATAAAAGTLEFPAPPDGVATWPLVGADLHEFWQQAHDDPSQMLQRYGLQIDRLGVAVLSGAGAGLVQILMFAFSLVISGLLLAFSDRGSKVMHLLGRRLAGERGPELTDLATATVRSVAKGVVGIAAIQTLLLGGGMMVAGIPATGLWSVLVLILAVVQLPPALVMVPVVIWYFTVADTVPAVLFTVWTILGLAAETVLKPLMFGRGMDIPMLVILLGAIGGMLSSGIIGLFVGAVVLALGYKLFLAWLSAAGGAAADTRGAADGEAAG